MEGTDSNTLPQKSKVVVKKSICTICDPGSLCGVDLHILDGKIIKVEGDKDQPSGKGTLCPKGAAMRQYVYSKDRIKTPLRRVGARGSDEFKAISWDEALNEIVTRLNEIKAASGPESVVFFSGYSKYCRPYLKRLAHNFGSPNYMTESSSCSTAMLIAQKLVFGTPGAPDISNMECLLVWSCNPFYANPANARALTAAQNRGMKLIVVDPRHTPTSQRANIHLRPRPGTDGALALSMAHVIISENLYNKEFVSEFTQGFGEYKDYVRDFTPEEAEKLSGVPANLIREAARMFATNRPGGVMPSASSIVHHTNGVQNYRAIFSLVGLTGDYDVKGGHFVNPVSLIHSPGLIKTREPEFFQSRPYSEMAERIGEKQFPIWNELISRENQAMVLPEQIKTGKPYPVRALLGFGLNYRMWPDSNGMLSALDDLDFFVNVDVFMTDSCKHADIVLPACTSVERSEPRCWPNGFITFTQPAIEPLYESRPDGDIICELSRRFKQNDKLLGAGIEACVDWMLEPGGITVEELKKHPGGMFVPNPLTVPEKKYLKGGFATPSGKLEFVSSLCAKYKAPGVDPLPKYLPPKYSPEGSPELAKEYPLILNTGSRLPMYVHSRTFRLPWISSLRSEPTADIHPLDAENLKIEQGDNIRIVTPKGFVTVKANLTRTGLPGVVHIFHDNPLADVNTLLEGDYLDPISGFPGYKSALCKLEKI